MCSCVDSGMISEVNNDWLCYRTVVPMMQHCLHMGYSHTNHSLNHNPNPLPNPEPFLMDQQCCNVGTVALHQNDFYLDLGFTILTQAGSPKSNLLPGSINMAEKLVVSVFECMLNSEWCMCCMGLTWWIFSLLSSYLSAQHYFCSSFTHLLISILRLCGRRSWLLVNLWFYIH